MVVRIVIGTALSGKTHFIKKQFPDSEIFSIGEYQRNLQASDRNFFPYIALLAEANNQIKNDMVEKLKQGADVVMEHTLYKEKRRKEYFDAFREVTDDPIDIYVMMPSDEQLKHNMEGHEIKLDWLKSEMREIEIPHIDEGFSHVYLVTDEGIKDWSDKPKVRKVIDKDTEINLTETKLAENESVKKIVGFGDKPFKHICEVCGKTEILTSKEAYKKGWDYPGEGAVYPTNMFGVLSPRTCGNCSIVDTAYFQVIRGKDIKDLNEIQIQTVERIMLEPDILKVDDRE